MCRVPGLLLLIFAAAACGDDEDDDEGGGGGVTCASVCAEQNALCGDSDDCSALCSTLADMNSKTGFGAPYQDALECLTAAHQRDDREMTGPGESYLACISAYCAEHPTEPFC